MGNRVKLLTQDGRNVANLQTEELIEDAGGAAAAETAGGTERLEDVADAAEARRRRRALRAIHDGEVRRASTDTNTWPYRVQNGLMFPPDLDQSRMVSGLEPEAASAAGASAAAQPYRRKYPTLSPNVPDTVEHLETTDPEEGVEAVALVSADRVAREVEDDELW